MTRNISIALREKWLLQKEPVVRRQRIQDTRGAARSDVCVDLGDSGCVRLRFLSGMRQLYHSNARLLEAAEGVGQSVLPTKGGSLLRQVACEIKEGWDAWLNDINIEITELSSEEATLLTTTEQTVETRRHKRQLSQKLGKLRRLYGEGQLSMARLEAVMTKLPTINVVRAENLTLKAEVDAVFGCERIDHRPLSRQFPGMSLAEIELKITSLELDEAQMSHKPAKSRSKGNEVKTSGEGGSTPFEGNTCETACTKFLVARKPERTKVIQSAQRYLQRRMQQTGVVPSLSLDDSSVDPDKKRAFELSGSFWGIDRGKE